MVSVKNSMLYLSSFVGKEAALTYKELSSVKTSIQSLDAQIKTIIAEKQKQAGAGFGARLRSFFTNLSNEKPLIAKKFVLETKQNDLQKKLSSYGTARLAQIGVSAAALALVSGALYYAFGGEKTRKFEGETAEDITKFVTATAKEVQETAAPDYLAANLEEQILIPLAKKYFPNRSLIQQLEQGCIKVKGILNLHLTKNPTDTVAKEAKAIIRDLCNGY